MSKFQDERYRRNPYYDVFSEDDQSLDDFLLNEFTPAGEDMEASKRNWEKTMGIIGGGAQVIGGLGQKFDYSDDFTVDEAVSAGKQKGGSIGSGVGAIAGSFLPIPGGSAIGGLVGKSIGSFFGGRKAEKKAIPIVANRNAKKRNFQSMYSQIAKDRNKDASMYATKSYLDSKLRANL